MNNSKSLLKQFEESEKEVYQVTQKEWINIMKEHFVNSCNRSEKEFNTYDKIEVECFHKSSVEQALKKDIEVSEIILKDYPGLIEQIKIEIEKEKFKQKQLEATPIFTLELFNSLTKGDKITIGLQKMTVCKKENNSLICKLYRCKRKGIELTIGERCNIKIGWC
jgi:hypothetical protein